LYYYYDVAESNLLESNYLDDGGGVVACQLSFYHFKFFLVEEGRCGSLCRSYWYI